MKLIVQPDAGMVPILSGIKQAKKSIDVLIFRMDRPEIAHAREAAVARGVNVRALTAHMNRGGDKNLRKLELQLLEGGITVSRTAIDLVRYHGKMMIIDGAILHVDGFDFTGLDLGKCRSLGIVTRNKKIVQEAMKLFEPISTGNPTPPGTAASSSAPKTRAKDSPSSSAGRGRELLIYDPKVSDDAILRILGERKKTGVEIKIVGKVESKWEPKWDLKGEKCPGKRLHIRAIIRDGRRAFIGSQSLRKLELEKRREVGVIVDDAEVVGQMKALFEQDWAETDAGRKEAKKAEKEEKAAVA